jgi:hypothetical protein
MNWEERPYQQEAIAACDAAFAAGKTSVMLESPVGSGKTYMALETVRRLEARAGRTLRVAWVAPRRHLLQQVMEANRDLHRLLVRPVSLFEKTPPPADVVVLDEAHHEATQSCVLLYEKTRAPLALGLSATPLRTDRMKLSFQETVRTCGIGRLVREGWLSPVHSYLLPHWGPHIVAACWLAEPERWGKSLVFFSTVAECEEFRGALAEGGVRCEVVTGESDKDAQLARFLSGETRVVANVSVLTEGFDQPDVQSVFARDASRVPTMQMCGRGLRTAPGKDHCNIVQGSGTPYLFERVAPPRQSFRFHEGRWLALQDKTREIEATLARSLELLEAREARAKARRPGMAGSGRARGSAQAAPPPPPPPPPIDEATKRNYQAVYWLYELCNRFGWQGALPPAKLSLDCSARATDTAGWAKTENGHPRISLKVAAVAAHNTATLMTVLFHEMVHVWQFAQGRRGGHGADFLREMMRLGIDERGGRVHAWGPAYRAMETAERLHPEIAERFRAMVGNPPKGQKALEEAIFAECLAAKARAEAAGGAR